MGTKLNPGTFDCYAKAYPDEPMFVLLARDPQAALLVRLWADVREGNVLGAIRRLTEADITDAFAPYDSTTAAQYDEARDCADAMDDWERPPS